MTAAFDGADRSAYRTVETEVRVRDIVVMADIGIHPHEIGAPQPLSISVRLKVQEVQRDQADQVFDYSRVAALADALGRSRIGLIEVFASQLAQRCLDHPLVAEATVTVEKPQALDRGVASVSVTLQRRARQ